jgi:hypothetical protein
MFERIKNKDISTSGQKFDCSSFAKAQRQEAKQDLNLNRALQKFT